MKKNTFHGLHLQPSKFQLFWLNTRFAYSRFITDVTYLSEYQSGPSMRQVKITILDLWHRHSSLKNGSMGKIKNDI